MFTASLTRSITVKYINRITLNEINKKELSNRIHPQFFNSDQGDLCG